MADRSWLEFSEDEDEEAVDNEQKRQIIDERLRKRKEEADKFSVPVSSDGRVLVRSMTVGSARCGAKATDGRRQRKSGGKKSGGSPVSCYGLLEATPSSLCSSSSATALAGYPEYLNVQPVNLVRPVVPTYSIVNDDVVFAETFDIWYTDPSVISNRGTNKHTYENACCYVGSFNTISEFYAFHNAIDWSNIPDGSVVAYAKKDVKPQWEDQMNAHGGRYMFKNFPRQNTEHIFTKLSLGFLSGLLTDWQHCNLISLHIRSTARGTDIQFWRKITSSGTGMNTSVVFGDIRALLTPEDDPAHDDDCDSDAEVNRTYAKHKTVKAAISEVIGSNATVTWMPNSGSMLRNDNRINHFKHKRIAHSTSLDTGLAAVDAWASGASSGGVLSDDLKKAMIAAADAELASVTPAGAGVVIPPKLTLPSCKAAGSSSPCSSSLSTVDSPGAGLAQKPGLARTQNVTGERPRRFCFTQVAELLPSGSDTSPSQSDHESYTPASRSGVKSATLNKEHPYPPYDAPVSIQAWQRGQALKDHAI